MDKIKDYDSKKVLVFLDFDNVHLLNKLHSYKVVDSRIKGTFSFNADIIARWYSGDEIVIIFNTSLANSKKSLLAFEKSAKRNNLTFTSALTEWDPKSESITSAVDKLSERVTLLKSQKARAPNPELKKLGYWGRRREDIKLLPAQ